MTFPQRFAYQSTRYAGLKYRYSGEAFGFYDFLVDPPQHIGPWYATRDELLADIERFAIERGFVLL